MEGLRVQNGKGGKKASIHERIGKPKIWGTEKNGGVKGIFKKSPKPAHTWYNKVTGKVTGL